MTYKDFCQQQRAGLSRDDLADLYDRYKSDYEIYHAESFFKEHREDCWFRERYDPDIALQWEIERRGQSRDLSQKFVEFFIEEAPGQDPPIRALKLEQESSKDYDKLVMSRTNEVARAPIFGYDANSMTLYLRSIPRNVSR